MPSRLLSDGGSAILGAPEFFFELQAKHIARDFSVPFKFTRRMGDYLMSFEDELQNAENTDFFKAVEAGALTSQQANVLRSAREVIQHAADAGGGGLPAQPENEFAIYHRGALAYRRRNLPEAQVEWEKLLQLPETERHFRSTWAAYMLGRVALENHEPERARALFVRVRELATNNFADTSGLAAASFGWEGRALLDTGAFHDAAVAYLHQVAAGDVSGVLSLKAVLDDAAKAENPAFLATDPILRRLKTVQLLAAITPSRWWGDSDPKHEATAWLAALTDAKIDVVEDAELVGWISYTLAQYDDAEAWLRRAKPDAPMTQWLEAKLLFRAGKIADAAQTLHRALEHMPVREPLEIGDYDSTHDTISPSDAAEGDLGMLLLARADMVGAFRNFLLGEHWLDAAFVAERVLTIDELQNFIAHENPGADLPAQRYHETETAYGDISPVTYAQRLHYLLGRRLVRAKRFAEARGHLPQNLRQPLDDYAAALSMGENKKLKATARADAFWKAAQLARNSGMELMGTEVEPDGFVWDGSYEVDDVVAERTKGHYDEHNYNDRTTVEKPLVLPVSAVEQRRLRRNVVVPEKRFHYRYIAADLAWRAAELLPDNDEKTALVLNTAGRWLKDRDDKAADRFYQAIEGRCPQTKIGREAVTIHWFPATETPEATPAP